RLSGADGSPALLLLLLVLLPLRDHVRPLVVLLAALFLLQGRLDFGVADPGRAVCCHGG
ncbi:hypothetical protein LCGC14_0801000, partial [marine sediment metagenome]